MLYCPLNMFKTRARMPPCSNSEASIRKDSERITNGVPGQLPKHRLTLGLRCSAGRRPAPAHVSSSGRCLWDLSGCFYVYVDLRINGSSERRVSCQLVQSVTGRSRALTTSPGSRVSLLYPGWGPLACQGPLDIDVTTRFTSSLNINGCCCENTSEVP